MQSVPCTSQAGSVPMALWGANALQSTEFLITVAVLFLVLIAGFVVMYFTQQWREKQDLPDVNELANLNHYRELFEEGEITESEYTAILQQLKNSTELKEIGRLEPPQTPRKSSNLPETNSE